MDALLDRLKKKAESEARKATFRGWGFRGLGFRGAGLSEERGWGLGHLGLGFLVGV